MKDILEKYAHLLVDYSLGIQKNDRLLIRTTTLAEPLVREVYKAAIERGGVVDTELYFEGQHRIMMQHGTRAQWEHVSPLYALAAAEYDTYLFIKAPFNMYDNAGATEEAADVRAKAMADTQRIYMQRTGDRSLRRSLCLYPTQAAAQYARMNLEAFSEFVYGACKLYEEKPVDAWRGVHEQQQHIVDHLNSCEIVRYVSEKTDISFSTKGRKWINSDGQTNMPSGEVYTSPVEDSVNGHIYFSFPSVYNGHEVRDVQLWVKDGYIESWEASRGKDFLDNLFQIAGTRRFGEAAIGTNYNIDRMTNHILFDEKMGGTIHMAIGQSYLQAGGKNESPVHWDMITEMRNGGQIYADNKLIYENGKFLI